jgi:hypothetical protein
MVSALEPGTKGHGELNPSTTKYKYGYKRAIKILTPNNFKYDKFT